MNIFYVSILSIAIILCYIDFFYILKNNVYFLEKGPDGRRRKANKKDAWLNFSIATVMLFFVLLNNSNISNSESVSNILNIIFVLLIIVSISKRKKNYRDFIITI